MSMETIPACTRSLAVETLSALRDNALGEADARSIEQHIPGCAGCRQRLAEYDALAAAMRSIPIPPPSLGYGRNPRRGHTWAAQRRGTIGISQPRRPSARLVGGVGALAAVLLISIAFAVVLSRAGGHPPISATATATEPATATVSATATTAPAPTFATFTVPSFSQVTALINGHDGNLWFAEGPTGQNIGRITPQGQITEFPIPTANTWTQELVSGPDGNLWFAELQAGKIGRVTPQGVMSEFPVPSGGPLGPLIAGHDGEVWFRDAGGIGEITSAGTITEFPLGRAGDVNSLAIGPSCCPDGAIWFTDLGNNAVGRVTLTGDIKEFPLPAGSSAPDHVTVGPDNNLWFTDSKLPGQIARVTPEGQITEFSLPHSSSVGNNLVLGPDGNLWFIEMAFLNSGTSTASYLDRITPNGSIQSYAIPTEARGNLMLGPDKNFWFADPIGIARMTTTGDFTEFAVQNANGSLGDLTVGPDGNIWFSEPVINVIVRAKL